MLFVAWLTGCAWVFTDDVNDVIAERCASATPPEGCPGTAPPVTAPLTVQCFVDADGDGFGTGERVTVEGETCSTGFADVAGDCDDAAFTANPDGVEVCGNGIDEDCVGGDEAAIDGFEDLDSDGFGGAPLTFCDGEAGVLVSGDCNDGDDSIRPDATEVCGNGIDEDCSGADFLGTEAFLDADGDGFGTGALALFCPDVSTSATDGDCDDANGDRNPGATEVCGNTIDEDCDGTDPGSAAGYVDIDNDGVGSGAATTFCVGEPGYVPTDGDCAPSNPNIFPGAVEVPVDGIDQNCDNRELCWVDLDDDGFGNALVPAVLTVTGLDCDAGIQLASAPGDCNDSTALVSPGATPVAGDGIDQDCDGSDECLVDADTDGFAADPPVFYAGTTCPAVAVGDCNDGAATVFPGATELCDGLLNDCTNPNPPDEADADGDGVRVCDNDCNDSVVNGSLQSPLLSEVATDDLDNDCDGTKDCYLDADLDTYGDIIAPVVLSLSCLDPGLAIRGNDCDDLNFGANPGRTESPSNDFDDDCDGTKDCFDDQDQDDVGGTVSTVLTNISCVADPFRTLTGGDCNDADAEIFPGALEKCDGLDSNCDLSEDPGAISGDGVAFATLQDAMGSDVVEVCGDFTHELEFFFAEPFEIRGREVNGERPVIQQVASGARIIETNTDLLVSNVVFDGTVGSGDGSFLDGEGLFMHGGTLTLDGVTVTAFNGSTGGAIHLTPASSMTVFNSSFSSNLGLNGGAVHCDGCELAVFDSAFVNNLVPNAGGGLFITGATSGISMSNVEFFANDATETGSGLAVRNGASLTPGALFDVRFVQNNGNGFVPGEGAALDIEGGGSHMCTDCLFDANTAEANSFGASAADVRGSSAESAHLRLLGNTVVSNHVGLPALRSSGIDGRITVGEFTSLYSNDIGMTTDLDGIVRSEAALFDLGQVANGCDFFVGGNCYDTTATPDDHIECDDTDCYLGLTPPLITVNGLATCTLAGDASTTSITGEVECLSTPSFFMDYFAVPVLAGDCLWVRADNVGSVAADLVVEVIDEAGDHVRMDDDWTCTNQPGSFGCPENFATAATDGVMYVGIGQYSSDCLPGESSPYQLTVALNGANLDLAPAFSAQDIAWQ